MRPINRTINRSPQKASLGAAEATACFQGQCSKRPNDGKNYHDNPNRQIAAAEAQAPGRNAATTEVELIVTGGARFGDGVAGVGRAF